MASMDIFVGPAICFSRNPVPLHIEAGSDWANAGGTSTPTIYQLVFSSNIINVGETLTINYNGIIYVFEVVASPNGEENEIQSNTSLTIANWIDNKLTSVLQNNYSLSALSCVRSGSTLSISGEYESNLEITTTIAACAVTKTAVGSAAIYPTGYKIYATVLKKGISDADFQKVAEISAVPELQAPYLAKFDLQEIVDSVLGRTLPDFEQNSIKIAENNYVGIKVNYAQLLEGTYRANHTTNFGVYFGGVSLSQFPINSVNYPLLISNTYFLTWQPYDKKRTTPKSQEYLLFIPFFDLSPSPTVVFRVNIRVYKRNGDLLFSGELFPDDTYTKFIPLIIPCGMGNPNVASILSSVSMSDVAYYDISVAQGTNNQFKQRFTVDFHNYNNREKYFLIGNSLGGFDTLVCTTNHSESVSVKKESYAQNLEYNFQAYRGVTKNTVTEAQTKYKVNTGLVEKEYIKYLKELLISDEIYIIENGNYYPVTIVGDSFNLYQNNSHLYSLEFEYILNYPEINYSNITA